MMSCSTIGIFGSANATAANADASMTLSVTIFTDHARGLVRGLQARGPYLREELFHRDFGPAHGFVNERKQFALQRAVVALCAPLQQLDFFRRNVLDRKVDAHRKLHFST